jgi:protein-L-isoaspartate(D-aspartate) O-methyltransferase
MIEKHLIPRGINDRLLLDAIAKVPREEFVSDKWKDYAYRDHPLQIACEQTISQPFIIAHMIQILQINPDDQVLEIGTGSGYQTAILAEMAKEVFTVERHEELSMTARKILRKLNYNNIHYKIGDGTRGWEKAIPSMNEFDKIIVCAGAPSMPQTLLNQLRENGRLIIPIGSNTDQMLILAEKKENQIRIFEYSPCAFVPLIGEEGWDN